MSVIAADERMIARRARERRSAWLGWTAAAVVVGALAFAILWSRGYLPGMFAPRKLVVRGCELTDPQDVLGILDCDGRQGLPALWLRARVLQGEDYKWLRSVNVGSTWGRSAILTVTERRPLLLVVSGQSQYWLCDDGWLAAREDSDTGAPFSEIVLLPRVALPEDPGPGHMADSEDMVLLAAACHTAMPRRIDKIELARNGEVMLYEADGFPIKLGQPKQIVERIAALPKALRVCEGHRDKLRYLDATDTEAPYVFYQKWKGPVRHMLKADRES